MIHVFHSDRTGSSFELVATVNTTCLDVAYELTNHIDCNWTLNAEVVSHVLRARSTSVGDVLMHGGRLYRVDPVGFSGFQGSTEGRDLEPPREYQLSAMKAAFAGRTIAG